MHEGTDYAEQPRFLQAVTENNSPRFDWGPKKAANQYGRYAHLRVAKAPVVTEMENGTLATNGFVNEQFRDDLDDLRETRF